MRHLVDHYFYTLIPDLKKCDFKSGKELFERFCAQWKYHGLDKSGSPVHAKITAALLRVNSLMVCTLCSLAPAGRPDLVVSIPDFYVALVDMFVTRYKEDTLSMPIIHKACEDAILHSIRDGNAAIVMVFSQLCSHILRTASSPA